MRACLLWLIALVILWSGEATLTLPDPWVAGVQQSAELTVTGEGQIIRIDYPEIPGVQWGQPQGQRSMYTVINGAASQSTSVQIPVQADGTETSLTIPPLTVHLANGGTLQTAPRTASLAKPNARLSGDGLVEAFFEPAEVFPGQPTALVLRVSLRARQDLQPGIAPPAEALSLGDKTVTTGTTVAGDGTPWSVSTFRWPLAFSASGSYTVSGQQAVLVPTGRTDGYGRPQGVARQLPVRPASIRVMPLPSTGRPADFTGVVGAITAQATLDRDRIAVGEGARVSLTVRGPQLDLLRVPPFTPPPGVQAYPRPAEDGDGGRIFRWDLVPIQPGACTVAPFSLSWFDPVTRSYRRTETTPLTLQVLPGRPRTLVVGGGTPPAADDTPAVAQRSPLPPPLVGQGGREPPATWALAIGVGGLLMGFLTGLLIRRARRAPARHRGQELQRVVIAGDPVRLAQVLADLSQAALTPEQRTSLEQLAVILDRHRFGGESLPPDLATRIAPLVVIP